MIITNLPYSSNISNLDEIKGGTKNSVAVATAIAKAISSNPNTETLAAAWASTSVGPGFASSQGISVASIT
jgi:hypothetical protein